jgi:hypothetical protein
MTARAIDIAFTHHARGELASAEALYWSMIDRGEDAVAAVNNLFALLREQQRNEDLKKLYFAAEPYLQAAPDFAHRTATTLLADGNFHAGWQWYEARRFLDLHRVTAPPFPMPEWQGEQVSSVLVWKEQGLGDQIQFARYVYLMRERGIDVTLFCHPSLVRLFEPLPARVVSLESGMTLPAHDRWTLAGSLPLRLGAQQEPPEPIRIAAQARADGGIGVMIAGSPTSNIHRTLSAEAARELLALPRARDLAPEATGARDLQDTAEIIGGLDLVITVDTSVAHLAGSMGKPTWLLLTAVRPDWRWLRNRTDSVWYPSIRIFRQQQVGDWASVVGEVREALESLPNS